MTLGCMQSLPDLMIKIHGLKNHFDPSNDPMPNLSPTYWGTISLTIQELKKWGTNVGVIVAVVGKLCKRLVGIPIPTKIYDTSLQHILKGLDGQLTLTVGLWMINSAEM